MSRILLLGALITMMSFTVKAQKTSSFPIHIIDTAIINKRGLQEKIRMLVEDCNWSERTGKKIDVFWLQTPNGNFFGHSYEYFMDCDNLRLIYWYDNPGTKGRPVDFMIENLETNQFMFLQKGNI